MKTLSILDKLDSELVERLLSRRALLKGGAASATAVAVATVPGALALSAREAFGQGGLPQGITDVLNFALTLEYLEAEFYMLGVDSGVIPSGTADVFAGIRDHESAHVALLEGVLGPDAVAKPEFDFTAGGTFDPFNDYQQFLVLSQGFEDTGVRAYKGGAGALMSDDAILTTALQIHSVEARHASVVRRIRGRKGWITGDQTDQPPIQAVYDGEGNTTHAGLDATTVTQVGTAGVTEAFDEPLSMDAVLAIADPFIV